MTLMSIPRQVYLPDPLVRWPWQRTLNPYHAEVKPQSDTWARGFQALDSLSQRTFDLYDFGEPRAHLISLKQLTGCLALLCGLGHPLLNRGLPTEIGLHLRSLTSSQTVFE
jgi:hypothetical protein